MHSNFPRNSIDSGPFNSGQCNSWLFNSRLFNSRLFNSRQFNSTRTSPQITNTMADSNPANFANLPKDELREIAAKGGHASHGSNAQAELQNHADRNPDGTFTKGSELAKELGAKGGHVAHEHALEKEAVEQDGVSFVLLDPSRAPLTGWHSATPTARSRRAASWRRSWARRVDMLPTRVEVVQVHEGWG
ncbi:hypothetical protein PMIN06_007902 [Paraphaeosphaeria minitans]